MSGNIDPYGELTLKVLQEAARNLPPVTYPKYIRISHGDYHRMRESCNMLRIFPEQPGGYTLGFLGEHIVPDSSIEDGQYEVDW